MVTPSQSPQPDLEKVFSRFNETSSTLVEVYQRLQAQVSALTTELAEARQAQARELDERERLARRLSLLLESLPGGVVVIDREGRVAECNPAAAQLFGEPLTGQSWLEVVHRVFKPQPDDGHDVSLASGRRVSISTCSLGNEPGQILLFNDVTENRRLENRIAHLRRLSDIGRMAASLAHQIRTPISSALLQVGNLTRAGLEPERREAMGNKLRDVLRHMERLVKDMLAFAHTGEFEVMELDSESLFQSLDQAGAAVCSQRGGTFSGRFEAAGTFVQGNPDALASVVQNLVNNAVEAGGTEVQVKLRVYAEEGELVIEVADDGPGMDTEQARHVFEPFVSSRAGGNGLGLAVAQAILQAHGGRIDLTTAKGQGCRFGLRLPVARHERSWQSAAGKQAAGPGGGVN